MLDIQVIAYICFSAIPLLTCFFNTVYYLFTSLVMSSYNDSYGNWVLTRPYLNTFFSFPLRKLRNLIEMPFLKIDDAVEKKAMYHNRIRFDSEANKPEKDSARRAAGNCEKISVLLEYFTIFGGELVLLLMLFLAMHFLLPGLSQEFSNVFNSVQEQILALNTSSMFSGVAVIIRSIIKFFGTMFAMFDATSWRWWVFIIVLLFTATPIRVWSVPEGSYTPRDFLYLLKLVASHYISSFIATFFSVQAVFALIAVVISLISTILGTDLSHVNNYIIHMSLYFGGIYLIAYLGQVVVYTADFIIGIVSMPFRLLYKIYKERS